MGAGLVLPSDFLMASTEPFSLRQHKNYTFAVARETFLLIEKSIALKFKEILNA